MTSTFVKNDILFSVLFVGDEHLIRYLVADAARRLGASDWECGIRTAGLVRLRVMFFLLLDRDTVLREKALAGWPELCIAGLNGDKAGYFFRELRPSIIDAWLMDERRPEEEFVSSVTDLYLVS